MSEDNYIIEYWQSDNKSGEYKVLDIGSWKQSRDASNAENAINAAKRIAEEKNTQVRVLLEVWRS